MKNLNNPRNKHLNEMVDKLKKDKKFNYNSNYKSIKHDRNHSRQCANREILSDSIFICIPAKLLCSCNIDKYSKYSSTSFLLIYNVYLLLFLCF